MSLPYSQLSIQFPTLDYPELIDHSLFDEFFIASLKAGIAYEREKFLRSWDESVDLERRFVEKSKHSHTRSAATELKVEFQALRNESYRTTRNSLFSYAYALYENEMTNPSVRNIALTPEKVAESTRALRSITGTTKNALVLAVEQGLNGGIVTWFANFCFPSGILRSARMAFMVSCCF